MASENLRIVQKLMDAWNSGDLDSVRRLVSTDIEWLEVGGVLEAEGTELKGWDEVVKGLESLFDAFESYQVELESMLEAGDRVVVILREMARGRTSGLEVATRFGYVITIREGEVARVEAYRDPSDAFAAAGISEPAG